MSAKRGAEVWSNADTSPVDRERDKGLCGRSQGSTFFVIPVFCE